MESPAFIEAVFSEPPIVLGVQLRPLSAGHKLLLRRFVPIERTPGSLALAVMICSQDYKSALADMSSPELSETVSRFCFALTHESWRKLWRRRAVDYEAEWDKFCEYVETANKCPGFKAVSDKEPEPSHCPEVLAVKVSLMRHLGITEAEFLDRPWIVSLWDYTAINEQLGAVKFLPENYEEKYAEAQKAGEDFFNSEAGLALMAAHAAATKGGS